MPLLTLMKDAAVSVLRKPWLLAVQLAGGAALFALFYYWLSLPDESVPDLALSTLLVLLLIAAFAGLIAVALVSFHESEASPARTAFFRLPRLAAWALLLLVGLMAVSWVSSLVAPALWHLGLVSVLVLAPLMSIVAGGGRPRSAAVVWKSGLYWGAAVWLLLQGYFLPLLLIGWVPRVEGLTAQTVSLVIRFGLAWLLAVVSWLMLGAVAGRILTQRNHNVTGESAS